MGLFINNKLPEMFFVFFGCVHCPVWVKIQCE